MTKTNDIHLITRADALVYVYNVLTHQTYHYTASVPVRDDRSLKTIVNALVLKTNEQLLGTEYLDENLRARERRLFG